MRFSVLGPLAVWGPDGRPLRVPERKVRALLAVLLAHEGRPVSTGRLLDEVWGAAPPGNPAGTLQSKISQLRRALAAGAADGGRLVQHSAAGYALRTPPEAVDAERFTTLLDRARAATAPADRTELLRQALALWRGPAFADFPDEPFARHQARRLEELRLTAVEERAEARLTLGEHAAVAGDLAETVARHPLRERLRAAHLRALYGAGRQNEALAGYAEVRRRLADELGIDPGPDLARLHQAMLTQDPALGAPAPAPATPAAPASRPAPAERPRSNLPAPVTELVGRSEAVDAVCGLLASNRLVTLTGSGGVGKTRLALAAAERLADDCPGGVWLVELSALGRHEDADVARTLGELVGSVLGVRQDTASHRPLPRTGAPPAAALAVALHGPRPLLVLDNCEHVVESVAQLADQLLRAVPELRILATSQEPLGLAGETLWQVGPLPQEQAVRLFTARARAAAPDFALTADTAEAVHTICRRLDGIPLALELAATRVRALGVRQLADRLDDRFAVLAAEQRGAPPRQHTLRAMIDWSWELLTDAERTVLRRLAVHADGCTLEAAEAVCSGGAIRPAEVADLLARLVDRSLVVVSERRDRYRLLESVAAYGAERLREAGEDTETFRRHRRYHTAYAERAAPALRGPDQHRWLDRLDAEAGNLRWALEGAAAEGDADTALRLVNALAWYWFLRGRLREARRSLAQALALPEPAPAAARVEAEVWRVGMALLSDGDVGGPVDAAVDAALSAYDRLGPGTERSRAWAQWFLGHAQWSLGDYEDQKENEARVERALAVLRDAGDRWGTAAALTVRASAALCRSDLPTLTDASREALALFRELGDRWGQMQAAEALGQAAEITGDYGEAARLHGDSLRIAEELGMGTHLSEKLSSLGRIVLLRGDLAEADRLHERARRLAVEHAHPAGEQYAELGLALSARRRGRFSDAEWYLRKWLERDRQTQAHLPEALILAELGFIAEQRGDAARAVALQREGYEVARHTGDPRTVALALEGLAGAHALAGRPEQAARLLGAAAATRAALGTPLPPGERGDVDRITATARSALGEAAFATAHDRGAVANPHEAATAPDTDPAPHPPPS